MAKEKPKNFEVVEVATETEPRVRDNETKETYSLIESICQVLNELKEVRKVVG